MVLGGGGVSYERGTPARGAIGPYGRQRRRDIGGLLRMRSRGGAPVAPVEADHAPCTVHPRPNTLHPAPCTLHPAPCIPHPVPYTLGVWDLDSTAGTLRLPPLRRTTHPDMVVLHLSWGLEFGVWGLAFRVEG